MYTALTAIDGHAAASQLLIWIGQSLLFGTLLAGMTWLVTRVLRRRLHPAAEATLWTIVLLKFLVPVGPAWSLSLASLCGTVPIDVTSPPGSAESMVVTSVATPVSSVVAAPHVRHEATGGGDLPWLTLLAAIYFSVAIALIAARLRSYAALRARCRTLPAADEPTRRLVQQVCGRLRVRRMPCVRVGDEWGVPFVMGLWRPMLVLPAGLSACRDELETVVVHEIAHLRRGDMIVRYLQWAAGTLLFFWPVVAWVNRRIDVARECACDEWALRQGKLTAGQYARCLLSAMEPMPSWRLAYHPCSMATNHTNIERRIDMILDSPVHATTRPARGIPALTLLLAWGGFSLTGAVGATGKIGHQAWPATAEAVKEHAIELYSQVALHETADINGDGVLSYREKSAYLIAVMMDSADAFMVEFPHADRDHSGKLDFWEAHDTIRGVTLIAYADRRPGAAPGARLDLEFYHAALDAQAWLLNHMKAEPTGDLENIKAVVMSLNTGRSDHIRKLDHGGPQSLHVRKRGPLTERSRFQELEGGIAAIEAKLAVETDAKEIDKLKSMLDKLEALLVRLNESDQ